MTEETVRPAVEVVELAIHILDHRGGGLFLSSDLVEISPEIAELFGSYISKNLQSDGVRMARFHSESGSGATIGSILDGSAELLEGSRTLAERLFEVMQQKNPGAGDIAVVRAIDASTDGSLLAILKLDLQRGFRREVTRPEDGGRVRLHAAGDLMPAADRRIQKCAFIPAKPHSFPYDLIVLDHQVGSREEGRVAAFFSEDFLECELVDGPKELTRNLPRETEKWLQEEGVTPTIAIQARQAVIEALHEPEVNLDQLAEQVFGPTDRGTRFLDHLESSGFETRTFSTDRGAADRLSSTLTYLLDNGVRISGDAEAVADLLQVDPDPTRDGKARIVIESLRFERRY